ncbi:hypothetical protein [Nostoc sp. NIES-3756]|nr:hypothetical protein [Nostoc sp. NIES-3756]
MVKLDYPVKLGDRTSSHFLGIARVSLTYAPLSLDNERGRLNWRSHQCKV